MIKKPEEEFPLGLEESERTYISKAEYLAGVINTIDKRYPTLRQDSKGP